MLSILPSRFLFPALALLAISACDSTSALNALRSAPTAENPYYQSLATLYQAYAETEESAYDWWTSKYFADKGLLAAYGHEVAPEDPRNWDIAPQEAVVLLEAREQLLYHRTDAAIAAHPHEAATAMAAYDCWVEQTDDGWKEDRIAFCKREFETALAVLSAPVPAAAPEIVAPAPGRKLTSSILYFPLDRQVLEESGMRLLNKLIAYLQNAGDIDIVIHGHADRAGDDAYNMKLSEERAKYVQQKLLDAGLKPSHVSYFAFGESDPKIPTDDGVTEPANRRVEIFLE
jgi:OOP family OmpA-OmpF porin